LNSPACLISQFCSRPSRTKKLLNIPSSRVFSYEARAPASSKARPLASQIQLNILASASPRLLCWIHHPHGSMLLCRRTNLTERTKGIICRPFWCVLSVCISAEWMAGRGTAGTGPLQKPLAAKRLAGRSDSPNTAHTALPSFAATPARIPSVGIREGGEHGSLMVVECVFWEGLSQNLSPFRVSGETSI